MEMTGQRRIEAPRETVWEALNDPEVLRASIPGCESVERTAPDAFQARVGVRIGPMSAKFGGKVTLTNINPPAGYTITGEGNGGAMGFAKGGADVSLAEDGPSATLLSYAVKAQVGGKMAQLGARLVDSTARQMADQFFDRFAALIGSREAATSATTTGTATATATASSEAPAMTASTAAPIDGSEPAPKPMPGTQRAPTPADHAAAAHGKLATKPAAPVNNAISLLSLIPREPYGMPIAFWLGSAVMLVVVGLLFVIG